VTERERRLEEYRSGFADVESALSGLTDEALDLRPADGGWTAREVVHHLADMETHAFIRLRQMIAVDRPMLAGHDDMAYSRRLHYDRPIEPSLAVVRAVREANLELLEVLTPAEWHRSATHPKLSPYDVEVWLRIYAEHPHAHADQIRAATARARRGRA
jgi:hypothetical protein